MEILHEKDEQPDQQCDHNEPTNEPAWQENHPPAHREFSGELEDDQKPLNSRKGDGGKDEE